MDTMQFDQLRVWRYASRREAGQAAGAWAAMKINRLLQEKETVNVLFAAAPSQDEMLAAFLQSDVDFSRIHALHMDEYIGLSQNAPQRFGHYLDQHAFSLKPFASVHYMGWGDDGYAMCAGYETVLTQYPLDIAFVGIGENGHIAFNDPHEADFRDPKTVRIVSLDDACRQQQVNDGCFATLHHVPTHAVTLTVPAIMAAGALVCTVPATQKARALRDACLGDVNERCPASILRTHADCVLFCDPDSGSLLPKTEAAV